MTLASLSIVDVWNRFGVGPLKHNRGRAFWRDGDGLNIAFDAAKGQWYDHVRNEGGGVLALVQTAQNTDRAGALRWLEAEGLIEPRETTPAERAEHARRRREAEGLAERVASWWRARAVELEQMKVAALEREDYSALKVAAGLLHQIQKGGAAAVYRQWRVESQTHPNETRELERAGRADLAECRTVAAVVVGLLTRAGMGASNVA